MPTSDVLDQNLKLKKSPGDSYAGKVLFSDFFFLKHKSHTIIKKIEISVDYIRTESRIHSY